MTDAAARPGFNAPKRLLDADVWPLTGAALSGALLIGAFGFELIGRYPPCPMCITQRWAHAGVLALGLALFAAYRLAPATRRFARFGALAMAGAFAVAFGFALQHVGVEYDWWAGPASCTGGGDLGGLTLEDLNRALGQRTNVVLCDEVAWSLFGVSMAGWNALFSLSSAAASLLIAARATHTCGR